MSSISSDGIVVINKLDEGEDLTIEGNRLRWESLGAEAFSQTGEVFECALDPSEHDVFIGSPIIFRIVEDHQTGELDLQLSFDDEIYSIDTQDLEVSLVD